MLHCGAARPGEAAAATTTMPRADAVEIYCVDERVKPPSSEPI